MCVAVMLPGHPQPAPDQVELLLRSVLPIDVEPVEHEYVDVGIEVQGGTEPMQFGFRYELIHGALQLLSQ